MNNLNCYYWGTPSIYDKEPDEYDALYILYIDEAYSLSVLKEDLKKEIRKNPNYLLSAESLFWNFLSNLQEREPCIFLRIPNHRDFTTVELKMCLCVDEYDLARSIDTERLFSKKEYSLLLKKGKKRDSLNKKKADKYVKEWQKVIDNINKGKKNEK